MNLYIFNQTRRGSVFGVGTYIRELTTALKKSDINICVVNLIAEIPQIKNEVIEGITYWHFPLAISDQRTTSYQKQWELYCRSVVYLLQLHIQDKKELIFHLNFFECSKLAVELKNAFDCKTVAVAHFSNWGLSIYDNLPRLRNILKNNNPDSIAENVKTTFEEERSFYANVDHIICLSDYMQKIMCCEYGLDASKISVIPNGLHDEAQDKNCCEDLRKKWNIPYSEKIILFAGRIDEVKGVMYLIKAFREVLKKYPDCRLLIAGSGNYDLYLREAKDICAKISFTGLLEKSELHEIYQIADVGVVPSLFEPFGYVPVEMMMHELPMVATATSGLNEVVDETCGLKIPITIQPESVEIDVTLLSGNILFLLRNPAKARKMGKNGRARYLSNYSSEIFRDNMLGVYNSLCSHNENDKIKTLIVTGQNNHTWEVSHIALKQILENSGLFTVDIAVSPKAGEYMFNFKPDFASYQLVVLDYYGDRWPEETEKSFLDYVEKGGGLVIYHAANNAFRHWKEYNKIIGFGGWENRNEADGPSIFMKHGQIVYDAETPGMAGSHGFQHEFVLHCGNPDHPVTKGLPTSWLHAQDELYDRMRGPGIIKDVLFWAYSDPETKGSGKDEIALFTVDYGKACIFHTTLGHAGKTLEDNISMQCAGFQVTLLRGAEWAATGKVTQQVPDDFPTETSLSLRKNYR